MSARPLDRMLVARRLAAGLPEAAVAAAAGRPVEAIQALRRDPDFAELVEGWRDLVAGDAPARDRRLVALAYAVLEDGLSRGEARVAIFVLREELRQRRAAATLARSLGRLIANDLARAAAGAATGEATGEDAAPARPPAGADPADRLAWQAAATLRRRMVEEHLHHWRATRAGDDTRPEPAPGPPAATAPPAPVAQAAPPAPASDTLPPEPVERAAPPAGEPALPPLLAAGAAPPALRATLRAARLLGRILAATPRRTAALERALSSALVRLPARRLDLLEGVPAAAMARLLAVAAAPPGPAMPEGP